MSRRFIAAVLIVSLGITGFAANSARAAEVEDIAKILGTVATLYFLGTAIQNSGGDDNRKVYVYGDRERYDAGRYDRDRYDHGRYDHDRYDQGRRTRDLPAACVLQGWNRKGRAKTVLGARCVERHYREAHRLPTKCRVQMRTEKGVRVVYEAGCLERKGFAVAHR